MKFFIPDIEDKEDENKLYDTIKEFAKKTTGRDIKDRKIYYIKWRHGREDCEARVGETQMRTGEMVMAILETNVIFLVCTPNRGVKRGMPILVGKEEIVSIIDFNR
ncbi:MAG: hypothetical protein ACYSWZ_09925 [Planctomycetota bacterium]|jgi:hypothetical protein